MAKIEKLQNVCYQNVLPTAFDDSRSYIETLYQVIYKVNELIESDETQYDNIEQRVGALESWKATVDGTIQVLQNANQQIQSQLQQFKYTQDDHTKKISDLENWKATTDSAIKVLQETSQHVQSQISQITSWQSATDTRILTVESDYTEIKGQFDAIQKSTTENSNAILTINESISALDEWKDQVSDGLTGLINQPNIATTYSGILVDGSDKNCGTWTGWVNNGGLVFNISVVNDSQITLNETLYVIDNGQKHNQNSTGVIQMVIAWARYRGLNNAAQANKNRVINENYQNIVYANPYDGDTHVIAEYKGTYAVGEPYRNSVLQLHFRSLPEETYSFSFNLAL